MDVAKFLQHDCVSSKTPGSSRPASREHHSQHHECVYMRKHRPGSPHPSAGPSYQTQHAHASAGRRHASKNPLTSSPEQLDGGPDRPA